MTRTGVVGHLSGIRIKPGLDARAAWAHGVAYIDPAIRVVTGFCGTQDDIAVAYAATQLEAKEGVDILYTMLNFGRQGAIEACRDSGIRQIGNVIDWTTVHPDVFIGSAVANNGSLVAQWVQACVENPGAPGVVRFVGMEDEQAVRLSFGAAVPAEVRARIARLAQQVLDSEIALQATYSGPELGFC